MSSSKKWLEILKKNEIEFEKSPNKEIQNVIDNIKNDESTPNLIFQKCPDEEFTHKYIDNLLNIRFEFKKIIDENALPFLDKNMVLEPNKMNLYDFLKIHSSNYQDLCKKIEYENMEAENDDEYEEEDKYYDHHYYEKD